MEFKEIGKAALEFEDDHLRRKLGEVIKVVEDIDENNGVVPDWLSIEVREMISTSLYTKFRSESVILSKFSAA